MDNEVWLLDPCEEELDYDEEVEEEKQQNNSNNRKERKKEESEKEESENEEKETDIHGNEWKPEGRWIPKNIAEKKKIPKRKHWDDNESMERKSFLNKPEQKRQKLTLDEWLRSDQELQINNLPWLSNAELMGLGKSGNNIQIMKREKSAGNILFLRATYALVKKHALRMTENEGENKKEEEKERKNEPINELNPNWDKNKKKLCEEEKEGALRMMKRSIGSIDKNNQKETEKFEMGRKQRDVNALMQKSLEEKEKSGKEIEKEIEESRRIMHRKRLDNMEKKRNNLLAQLEIENERNWGNKREYNSGRRFEKGRNDERRRIEKRMENKNQSEERTIENENKNEKDKQQKIENERWNSTIKVMEEKPGGKIDEHSKSSSSIAEELRKLEEIIKERNDENGKKKEEVGMIKKNKDGSRRESLEDRLRKLKERIGSGGGQKARNRYDLRPRHPGHLYYHWKKSKKGIISTISVDVLFGPMLFSMVLGQMSQKYSIKFEGGQFPLLSMRFALTIKSDITI